MSDKLPGYPVTETSPEVGTEVLIFDEQDNKWLHAERLEGDSWHLWCDTFACWSERSDGHKLSVTRWAPLPAPIPDDEELQRLREAATDGLSNLRHNQDASGAELQRWFMAVCEFIAALEARLAAATGKPA